MSELNPSEWKRVDSAERLRYLVLDEWKRAYPDFKQLLDPSWLEHRAFFSRYVRDYPAAYPCLARTWQTYEDAGVGGFHKVVRYAIVEEPELRAMLTILEAPNAAR